MSQKHAPSLLGSVNKADWRTHKHGLVAGEGVVRSQRAVYHMTSSDGVMEGCHALFGFPAPTVAARTPGLGKHVRRGSDWCTGLHTSCQSHFEQGNSDVVTDEVLYMQHVEVCLRKMKRSLVTVTNEGKD